MGATVALAAARVQAIGAALLQAPSRAARNEGPEQYDNDSTAQHMSLRRHREELIGDSLLPRLSFARRVTRWDEIHIELTGTLDRDGGRMPNSKL